MKENRSVDWSYLPNYGFVFNLFILVSSIVIKLYVLRKTFYFSCLTTDALVDLLISVISNVSKADNFVYLLLQMVVGCLKYISSHVESWDKKLVENMQKSLNLKQPSLSSALNNLTLQKSWKLKPHEDIDFVLHVS